MLELNVRSVKSEHKVIKSLGKQKRKAWLPK